MPETAVIHPSALVGPGEPPSWASLSVDVSNSNGTPNTLADVTGLSFSVEAGKTYWFKANIGYTAAATTTGSRWTVSGPSAPTSLFYTAIYNNAATAPITSWASTYQQPSGASAGSSTSINVAIVEGRITPSQGGTVVIQFASEIASSAITAKAGSYLMWTEI